MAVAKVTANGRGDMNSALFTPHGLPERDKTIKDDADLSVCQHTKNLYLPKPGLQ